jgi:hypothetical protein
MAQKATGLPKMFGNKGIAPIRGLADHEKHRQKQTNSRNDARYHTED